MNSHPFNDDTREKVGVIVYDRRGNILLVQGPSGKLSFPKGGRLRGETEHEGALRELYEETGLDLEHSDYTDKIKLIWGTYFVYKLPCAGIKIPLRPHIGEIFKILWRKPSSEWLQTQAILNSDLGYFIRRFYRA
jgi:8-oxo-dGTP pyrophosphatase MutT (NUDIX family)